MSFSRWVGIGVVALLQLFGCRHLTVEHTDRLVSTTPYQLSSRRLPEADHIEVNPSPVPGGVEIRLKEELVCVKEDGEDVKTERTTVRRPDWEYTGLKLGATGLLAGGGVALMYKASTYPTKPHDPDSDTVGYSDGFGYGYTGLLLVCASTPFLVTSIVDLGSSRTKKRSEIERRPTRFQQEACTEEPARVAIRLPDGELLRGKALSNGHYFIAIPDAIFTRYSGIIQADIYVRERIVRHVQIGQVSR